MQRVSGLDWSQVEPAIFGTLFERGLDPEQADPSSGALHGPRLDRPTVEPVVMSRCGRDFEETKRRRHRLAGRGQADHRPAHARPQSDRRLQRVPRPRPGRQRARPRVRLRQLSVLALRALKDLEREAILWASLALEFADAVPPSRPASCARASRSTPTRRNSPESSSGSARSSGCSQTDSPTGAIPSCDRSTASSVATRVLDLSDPSTPEEPDWPDADFIVGNPPFLGGGDR